MAKRGRPPYPGLLTPREQEVLALLREGLNNPQIAERLGISRDGAKYHVSEIISKLGVTSREEAARWRPEEARPWWAGALAPAGWPRFVAPTLAAVVVAGVLGGLALMAVLLLRDAGEGPTGQIVVPVTELFTDPRPRDADQVRSVGSGGVNFDLWDGESTVLYDTATGEELNLGQGYYGRFSIDGRWMAWTAGPPYEFDQHEAWIISLETKERRRLSPGNFLHFVDENTVAVQSDSDQFEVVDLTTGERTVVEQTPPEQRPADGAPEHYELRVTEDDTAPFVQNAYTVVERVSGETLFEFDGLSATAAAAGELVVATVPSGAWSNIFIVEVATGEATFITSGRLHYERGQASPLSADDKHVLWTDDACSSTPGNTRLYYRDTGALVEIDTSLWAWLTDDGLIATGAFGPHQLIDPESLAPVVTVPAVDPTAQVEGSAPDVGWSPDRRYFSRGFAGGHGGVCF